MCLSDHHKLCDCQRLDGWAIKGYVGRSGLGVGSTLAQPLARNAFDRDRTRLEGFQS